jgi:iron complex outermembrane receptor protein
LYRSLFNDLPLITFSLVLGLHVTANAQAVDELTVQSGRLVQRLFDTPGTVTAIDGQIIRDAGPQVNLSEALASVPGVVALNRNNYAQDVQISIRGFGARTAFGLRGIRLITDGIPATIPDGQGQASTVAITSADRIEVLTGPLAQLYGNSAGGVIQTFTREASPGLDVLTQVTTGSNGLRRYSAQLSGRNGGVGIVADYSEFSTDGWRANSAAQRKQFNGVLTSQLQQNTRLKIVANVFDMPQAQDPLGLTLAQLAVDPRQAGSNALARNTRKYVQHQQLGSVLEHRFNNALQMQIRAYSGTRENLQYLANAAWIGLNRDFSGLGLQFQGRQRPPAGGQVQWVLGLDVDKSAERRQAGDTLNGQKIGDLTRNELNRSSNRDVYAQANWQLDPNVAPLTLTTGLRQSEVQLRSRDDYFADGYDGSGNVKYRATNPVLGVTWHAAETLNVYANWGKGFETPTLAEAAYAINTNNNVLAQFNPMLLASRSQHKELGLKWMPSHKTRVQAAVFHIGNNDEIVVLKSSFGQTAYKNASATTRQGAELAWAQLWTPHWSSQLSASWLQARYDRGFSSIIAGNIVSIPAGNRLPGIPDKQLFASIQWAQNGFAGNSGPLGWSSSLDWIARSALWGSDMNDEASRAPGYGVLNARMRHRSDWGSTRLEAWLGIDNLGNRSAVSSVIVNQSSAQYFEPSLPRQWVLGVKLINML